MYHASQAEPSRASERAGKREMGEKKGKKNRPAVKIRELNSKRDERGAVPSAVACLSLSMCVTFSGRGAGGGGWGKKFFFSAAEDG